jgi:uncharacterized repeat protein (TIGR01451 family)
MKPLVQFGAVIFAVLISIGTQAQQVRSDIGPDWRTYPALTQLTNQTGTVSLQTNTVVELGGGMNRWDQNAGDWVQSSPELTITDEGVVGHGARHQVRLAANLNSAAAVQVQFPGEGTPQFLKTHLLGLFYEDIAAGTNVLIADLQDSIAQVSGPQVYYFDAFSGVNADVRYSYGREGISQEILFREPLPAPQSFQLSAGSVRLVAITEVVEGPQPQIQERDWQVGPLTQRDQGLDFGSMRMVPGLAFRLGGESDHNTGIPVTKEYRTQDGRRLILERISYASIQEQLSKLSPSSNTNRTASLKKSPRWLAQGTLPPPPLGSNKSFHAVQNASLPVGEEFVLDWNLVTSTLRDFTFRSSPGVSYVVANDIRLTGTTTIVPGAVIRFHSASLYVDGPLNLPKASGLQKPVLTSVYDETVGPAARAGAARALSRNVPALVVRAQDYKSAAQQIEARHPHARIIPDRPTALPSVSLEPATSQLPTTNAQGAFMIQRVGGDWSQPLVVGLTTSTGSTAGLELQGISSLVTIPAGKGSVEVPIPAADPIAEMLTVQPDPNGAYVPEGSLAAMMANVSPMLSAAVPAPANLVGWWKAEANANDSSGNNHNGTLKPGATYDTVGEVGQTFKFDGVSGYVEVPDDAALRMTGEMTIEFWLKRLSITGAYEYLVEKGGVWNGGQQNYALQIHGSDNDICFTCNGVYRMAGVINDYAWHHVAVVAVNGQVNPTIYLDGAPQTISQSNGGSINLYPSTLPLHIGAQIDTSWKYYSNTDIDELSIYNRALSQAEIQSIVNAGSSGKTLGGPACYTPPSGLVSWWKGEWNANDSIGVNHGSFGGSYVGGEVGQAFSIVNSSTYVTVPASSSLNVGTGNGLTIEGWINPADDTTGRPVFEYAGSNYGVHCWANFMTVGSLYVNIFDTAGVSHYFWTAGGLVTKNTFQHVAISYDHASGNCQVFVNGQLKTTQPLGVFTPQTSWPLYFGSRPASLGGGNFNGTIDEASLYNRALSAAEILGIYNAGTAGKCGGSQPVAPTITTQPQSQTVIQGANATFTVVATGTAPLSYQWKKNGTAITGATATSYTIFGAQASDAATYTVTVSNSGGNVTSSGATLTVIIPPSISVQPANQYVPQGGNATFCVTAGGSLPLSYQWQFNGSSIGGATANCFTVVNAAAANAGNYAVVVSNAGGNLTSANASLTVTYPSGLNGGSPLSIYTPLK